MRNRLVVVPSIAEPITRSPGFEKKGLATWKLDLAALCGFGCAYCSSNMGNYLRINQKPFGDLTEQQLGERVLPADDPSLMFVWPDILEKLERQLHTKPKSWGQGQTLVFSMLTDGFSPYLVTRGITAKALDLVLGKTSFRIRVLTKNCVVGSDGWIEFFLRHPDRFVVGLSIGTLDDEWARRIEVGTSSPTARLRALRDLQDANVPTYGMLCPIFPGVEVEHLAEQVRPIRCEVVWAEPYNDRVNWQKVRDGHEPGAPAYEWFNKAFSAGRDGWSRYAVELYDRLRRVAERQDWVSKLKFLLYESYVAKSDAPSLADFAGLLLQSSPAKDGLSSNRWVAEVQRSQRDVYEYVRDNYSEELVEHFQKDGIALSWAARMPDGSRQGAGGRSDA